MTRRMYALIAAVLLAMAANAATNKPQQTPVYEGTLATVNGDPLTAKELVDKFTERHGGHAKFLGGPHEARSFLDMLVDERLLLQEAYELGLDKDPAVVAAVAEFERDKSTAALVRREVDDKAAPTAEQVKSTWEKQLNFFVQVKQIGVESRAEAEEIRRALASGADFETIARQCSKAPSSHNGGHLLVNWGQFDPEWERVVFALEPGELSPVIETPAGFDVVVADGRLDAPRPQFDKVSEQITAVLRERNIATRQKEFSAALWTKYHVVIQQFDRAPAAIVAMIEKAPATVIATWDNGGKLTAAETFEKTDVAAWLRIPAAYAQRQIDARIHATVNGPLIGLEAKNANIAQLPEIVDEVAKYRESMMQKALARDHMFKDVTVSEAEVRKYYDRHGDEFMEPEQRHVAHVMSSTEADAKKVYDSAKAGAEFEILAAKYSRDYVTARSGGDLGWITTDRVPEALQPVLKLAVGEVSNPLHSATAWHVVKVLEIKPQRKQPFDEVQEQARAKAIDTKKAEARKFWIDKLRAASKIEIDEKAIAEFVKTNQYEGPKAFTQH